MSSVIIFLLCACSGSGQLRAPNQSVWNDAHFAANAELKLITKDELFTIDADLQHQINLQIQQGASTQDRANHLLEMIYHDSNAPFLYESYHSTTASETWKNKRGNCISLTILAYSLGKSLQLPIAMQEVDVPLQFDRQGNTEYINAHVNTIILSPALTFNKTGGGKGFMLIDFDPELFTMRRSRALSEDEILARFYNNLGAEFWAKKNKELAYAYFKAAIMTDPSFSSAYSNLAQLYVQQGLFTYAEDILRHALNTNRNDAVMMRTLQTVYFAESKNAQVLGLNAAIKANEEANPYYWMGLGMRAMFDKNYQVAIKHFEKAEKLTHGFEEIHQSLAEAYLRTGEKQKAETQLAMLKNLNPDNPKLNFLRLKLAVR
ncbi:MAG: tetratricopeptide repeat protein [Pseudomonadota bacterium]